MLKIEHQCRTYCSKDCSKDHHGMNYSIIEIYNSYPKQNSHPRCYKSSRRKAIILSYFKNQLGLPLAKHRKLAKAVLIWNSIVLKCIFCLNGSSSIEIVLVSAIFNHSFQQKDRTEISMSSCITFRNQCIIIQNH
mgnify:CR=1 FL=1